MQQSPQEIVAQFSSFDDFAEWFYATYGKGAMTAAQLQAFWNIYRAQNEAETTGDYNSVLGAIANNGGEMSPEYEKWLDNEIANQRTIESRDYETQMRDTSLLSAAGQLKSLGLSTSNVIQTGGVSSGVNTGASSISHHSVSQLRQQARINTYNQNMSMAKSIIGMAGSMASSGIYGSALGATKNAAAKLASATAHSGLNVLKHHSSQKMSKQDHLTWDQIMHELGY